MKEYAAVQAPKNMELPVCWCKHIITQKYYLMLIGRIFPKPKVESTVIKLIQDNKTRKINCDESIFISLVKQKYNLRRKKIKNSLKSVLLNFEKIDLDLLNKRAEDYISVEEFIKQFYLITKKMNLKLNKKFIEDIERLIKGRDERIKNKLISFFPQDLAEIISLIEFEKGEYLLKLFNEQTAEILIELDEITRKKNHNKFKSKNNC